MAGFLGQLTIIKAFVMTTQTLSRPTIIRRRKETISAETRPISKKKEADKDLTKTYNEVKQF